jgi:hypothetical protein
MLLREHRFDGGEGRSTADRCLTGIDATSARRE